MSPDEKLRGIQHRNAAGEQINRKDVTWLLNQLHRQKSTLEQQNEKWMGVRRAVDSVEDWLRVSESAEARVTITKVVSLLRRVVGPR